MGEQLNLLSVRCDDCELVLSYATLNEGLDDLMDESTLDFVLNKVPDAGVSAWYCVSVKEDGLGAVKRRALDEIYRSGRK